MATLIGQIDLTPSDDLVSGDNVVISWVVPNIASDEIAIFYEIYFTDDYRPDGQVDWVEIASVPSSDNSFTWAIPARTKGSQCRLGARARLLNGSREAMLISPSNFSIEARSISQSAVISPSSNETYHMVVPILIDDLGIKDTVSQRAYYEIFYSSDTLGIDWTVIRQNVYIGYGPIEWDISEISPSEDYRLKIILMDDNGLSSNPVFIDNLKLTAINSFTIDTTAPVGDITIDSNLEFTSNKNIVMNLKYFDETTAVESVQIKQSGVAGIESTGSEQVASNVKTWFLSGDDGIKFIEAVFKDYAGNVVGLDDNNDSDVGRFFRTNVSSDNSEVSCFTVLDQNGSTDVWTAFNSSPPSLYRGVSIFLSLSGEATSIISYSNTIYIGIKTTDNKGILERIDVTNRTASAVHSFLSSDSVITSMETIGNNLYIGLYNGELYVYNGLIVSLVYTFSEKIENLSSDGSRLYISLDHTINPIVYDGSNFTDMDVINGYSQIVY